MMQFGGFQSGHACQVAGVSRAGFYRHYEEHQPRQAEVARRDESSLRAFYEAIDRAGYVPRRCAISSLAARNIYSPPDIAAM
jgi:hypothetical protein